MAATNETISVYQKPKHVTNLNSRFVLFDTLLVAFFKDDFGPDKYIQSVESILIRNSYDPLIRPA
jgi:hypothetical protein